MTESDRNPEASASQFHRNMNFLIAGLAIISAICQPGGLFTPGGIGYLLGTIFAAVIFSYALYWIVRLILLVASAKSRMLSMNRFVLISMASILAVFAISQTIRVIAARVQDTSNQTVAADNHSLPPTKVEGTTEVAHVDQTKPSPASNLSSNDGWPLPPLVEGDWSELAPTDYRTILDEVISQSSETYRDQAQSISRIRVAALPFFKDGYIAEGLVEGQGRPGIYTFVMVKGAGVVPLTGSGPVIHQLIQKVPFELNTRAQADAYLRFFNGAVSAENGTFRIADSLDSLDWLPSATDADKARVAKFVRPLVMSKSKGGWAASATVEYGSSIYSATYEIDESNGNVEMKDDFSLVDGLPLRRLTLRGPLRVQIGSVR